MAKQKLPRPREVVAPAVRLLTEQLSAANPGLEWHVAGSWRRGAPGHRGHRRHPREPGRNHAPDLFSSGVVLPTAVTIQRLGEKIAQGDLPMPDGAPLHIDFWSCKPNERGAFLMFTTGPKELNLYQRRLAVRHGMALSQVGLLDRVTKRQLDDGTEEDVYRRLRLPFLTPQERQRWVGR